MNASEAHDPWLEMAAELQALAQAGLYYAKDPFDTERYTRIRQIAAELLCLRTDLPAEKVTALFCCETGYQTPKLDIRAAVFREDRILLVRERDGCWALPGGWVDAGLSVAEAAVKEVREEAGLAVTPVRVIAVQDRDKHNQPPYIWKICKVFLLCRAEGDLSFAANSETSAADWFAPDALPPLSQPRINAEQIAMCFRARDAERWEAVFD